MKKVIGILGVAVFAVTLFYNSNSVTKSDGSLDLASLMTLNTANAEDPAPPDSWYRFGLWTKITVKNPTITYSNNVAVLVNGVTISGGNSFTYSSGSSYSYWDCIGVFGNC